MRPADDDGDALVLAPVFSVELAELPVAAFVLRDSVIVAVNAAYVALFGRSAEEAIGRHMSDEIVAGVVSFDVERMEQTREAVQSRESPSGSVRVRVSDPAGRKRSLRVEWVPLPQPGCSAVFMLDEERDERVKDISDRLARASASFSGVHAESEILERAVHAIVEVGFTARVLLVQGDGPALVDGPSGRPPSEKNLGEGKDAANAAQLSLALLRQFNPQFDEGRAAFSYDVDAGVEAAGALSFPVTVGPQPRALSAAVTATAEAQESARVGGSFIQMPLLVDEAVFGALVLTGAALSPGLVGPFEMFAELIARAIENVRMRARLVERERLAALGEAAAVMAHEVRNPIAAILNAVGLMRRDAAPIADMLAMIAEESNRLERIVTALLTLGRPLLPKLSETNLIEVAFASRNLLVARDASVDGIAAEAIVISGLAESPLAILDPDLVELAVLNVFQNALQASPPGGRVLVSTEFRDGIRPATALCIDDEGSGFPAGSAERIFEPFFTTRAAGTGVGLAVVLRIVEACGGRVEAGSSPSGGARVALVFPAANR